MSSALHAVTEAVANNPVMDWLVQTIQSKHEAFGEATFRDVTTVFVVYHATSQAEYTTVMSYINTLKATYNSQNLIVMDVNTDTGPVPLPLASMISSTKSVPVTIFVQYGGKLYQQATPLTLANISLFLDGFRS